MIRKASALLISLLTVLGVSVLSTGTANAAGNRLYNLGSCATPEGNSTSNGAVITVWSCTGSNLQNWHWLNQHIVHDVSGKCLTPRGNASATNGTVLTLWTCDWSDTSPQVFAGNSGRTWTQFGGKCITNKGNSSANGTWLTLWTCNPEFNTAQAWGLVY
ncbi:RICIN domain-containing protein [Streptomyces sp. MS191]|uniref:RICIN domain-containing protein n=2 Tax=unclassified Streptomyces TaxID=2593676 RepID=UPI00164F1171|nr:ricin-type beta-trefoil lectin domain protein [Streptomyces sp. ms191]